MPLPTQEEARRLRPLSPHARHLGGRPGIRWRILEHHGLSRHLQARPVPGTQRRLRSPAHRQLHPRAPGGELHPGPLELAREHLRAQGSSHRHHVPVRHEPQALGPQGQQHGPLGLPLQWKNPERRPRPVAEGAAGHQVGAPEKPRHEGVARRGVDGLGRPGLLHLPGAHHRQPVREGHGLLLIVRDEHHGRLQGLEHPAHLAPGGGPQRRIEAGEGLIEEQHPRSRGQRPGQRHPLLLTSRKRMGHPRLETAQPEQLQHGAGAGHLLPARQRIEAKGDVVQHGQVGEEGEVLKHHAHPALVRRKERVRPGQQTALQRDGPGLRPLETGHQPQRRRLAAARGANQGQRLARGQLQAKPIHRGGAASGVTQGDVIEREQRHRVLARTPIPHPGRAPSSWESNRPTPRAETAISTSADGAAWANRPSAVALQTRVASVSKPMGASNSVAGSSFMAVRKTSAAPASHPGVMRGTVTRAKTEGGVCPSVAAASAR
ncbi:permeases of the major facilitator superfamily [Stigmatella aurantiaca DW4/3-1]|uniref:Permeases of the major facilitator superfamily n=1 Tax=Stigmatella aurantiaca (strain DW4/3-1) TaxID=378806 RepID=Q09DS9_STIAD|nr:permeases of the major facilitator superfamily [Stigmatella aurantiaca DW4/3-1]